MARPSAEEFPQFPLAVRPREEHVPMDMSPTRISQVRHAVDGCNP